MIVLVDSLYWYKVYIIHYSSSFIQISQQFGLAGSVLSNLLETYIYLSTDIIELYQFIDITGEEQAYTYTRHC